MNPTTEVTSKSCQTYFFSFVRLKLLTKMAVWSMLQAILPWLLRKARIFMPAASWTLHNDIVSNQNVIWDPNRYKKDLSNEVLNIEFDKGAAKISEVKGGVRKRYLPISPVRTHVPGVSRVGRYFFRTPDLTSGIFAAPWPKSMFSTSFKRCI